MAVPDPGDRPSWASVLAELESAVADVEQGLLAGARPDAPLPWSAPSDMGPLPAEFRTRAADLVERQAAAAELLDAKLLYVQRQRRVTGRLFPQAPRPAAVYIDKTL